MLHNVHVLVVCYTMRKVNLAYLSGIISLPHTCTHAVPRSTPRGNPISPRVNINLHMTRHGHWISPRGILYMMWDLAVEACCTIHKNDY